MSRSPSRIARQRRYWKDLLKRANKLKVWHMSEEEALRHFSDLEVARLKSYYLVANEDTRRSSRRCGIRVELPEIFHT